MMVVQQAHPAHENVLDVEIQENETPIPLLAMAAFTGMTLTVGKVTVPSNNGVDDPIRWAQGGWGDGEIRIDLGGLSLPTGIHDAALVIYSPTWPQGRMLNPMAVQVWPDVEAS